MHTCLLQSSCNYHKFVSYAKADSETSREGEEIEIGLLSFVIIFVGPVGPGGGGEVLLVVGKYCCSVPYGSCSGVILGGGGSWRFLLSLFFA